MPSLSHLGEIITLPNSFSSSAERQEVMEQYKQLRLYGLQANPEAFSSTYEDESQFSDEVWLSRIQNPAGRNYAAVSCIHDPSEVTPATDLARGDDESCGICDSPQKEWLGIVTLLGPSIFPRFDEASTPDITQPYEVFVHNGRYHIPFTAPNSAELRGAHLVYLVVGMFVSPTARRRRYGQRLMEAVIAAATQEGEAVGAETVSITLQVETLNSRAQRLYERLGFKVVNTSLEIENHGGSKSYVTCLELVIRISKCR
ncbi:hypothetical protein POX_c04222 [Penicillium oxalicum]|uniref:hypothetical protein n=1 Tax=Penicillium oxalicum TaxID=69781 RepID=UPI0020B6EB2F|nr:hypothetical protein POX_c04222 [Penicillium oxalicum]KAI2791364.1 hypothetical protein POX_c04222 [Penicillium oxalicum]